MLSLTGYRLVLLQAATDMRLGINGLSGIVCNELQEDPFRGGTIYAFFNGRRNQVKLLLWDTDGFAVYLKRLSKGTFGLPVYNATSKSMELTKKDLLLMLEGIEIKYRVRYERK